MRDAASSASRLARLLARLSLGVLIGAAAMACAPAAEPDDPLRYIAFVQEAEGTCVSRNAMQLQVRNTHPTRRIRVWLDRYLMGTGTGDRSRSDLDVGGAPQPLGCSRNAYGAQEWRPVRAMFLD